MLVHKLIDEIKRQEDLMDKELALPDYNKLPGLGEEVSSRRVTEILSRCEKFELPPFPATDEAWSEVLASVNGLGIDGSFLHPYQEYYIECSWPTQAPEFYERCGLLVSQNIAMKSVALIGFLMVSERNRDWRGAVFMDVGQRKIINQRNMARALDEENITHMKTACVGLMTWLTYLTGVHKNSSIRFSPPEKLNKVKLKNRETPIDSYTRVLLPHEVRAGGGGRSISERYRPKEHPRRGHLHKYWTGKGRSVMIEKVLSDTVVNKGLGAGRVFHLQYGQTLTQEMIDE